MTNTQTISFKLPLEDARRIPARNRSKFIREAVREKLARPDAEFQPVTAFGKKLAAMRAAHVRSGARLLSAAEISNEVRARRGSLA